jgi:microcystin-dependent protein
MSVAGNIEVVNPLVRRVFTNTAENDMAIFVDSPGQSIHLGCTSNATVPSTVMITQSNLVLNGDIMFPNRVIAMSRLRVTQPENLMIPANISTSYSSVPGVNPSNGSNFDLSLGGSVSNFRFLQTSTGNICASLGFDGSLKVNSLLTNGLVRLNNNGALSNITGLTMSNGQILGSSNDTAGSPGFAWNNDTGTGLFHVGTGQVGVAVGGTQVASFSNGGLSVTGVVDATTLRQGGAGVVLTTGGTISGAVTVNNTLTATTLQQGGVGVVLTSASNQTVTGALTVNGTFNANTYQQGGNALAIVPIGMISPFAGNTAPNGWLICDGQEISRTTYAGLFAVIGLTYGSTSSTTFKVPDMRGRLPLAVNATYSLGNTGGSETTTLSAANLPPHTHGGTTQGGGSHNHGGSITTSQNGSHAHSYQRCNFGGGSGTGGGYFAYNDAYNGTTGDNGNHDHTVSIPYSSDHTHTFTTGNGPGSSSALNVLNPYIALNYIIKF